MNLPVGVLLFAFMISVTSAALGETTESQADIEARLKALEEEISRYKEMLETTEGQKSEIEKTLERNEEGISELINQIDEIETKLKTSEDKISSLSNRREELQAAKKEQQYYIERQIRAAYEIGNQEYLKVLLNQEDPNEIARMLTYYDYFNKARADAINAYNVTIDDLSAVTRSLGNEMAVLADTQRSLQTRRESLSAAQREKRTTLGALIAEIESTGSEISRLEQDRQRLEQLMDRIQQQLARIPTPETAKPFSDMQGRLLLPVQGKISHRFGNQRNQGKLSWHGVFIEASEGDPVFAVHYGRVVFSDWLRGFGLLLIISHGDGYMSLYGHNQALYRETGDWVSAGEVIATVGDSGGQNRTGLYFEIRIAGKPADPQQWCVARDQRAA